jgi:excinuclease ABC subunit A
LPPAPRGSQIVGVVLRGAISIRGAEEHNLQSVSVDIPHAQLTAVSGLSGSGKTSLVFDTLYAEARRRYLSTMTRSGVVRNGRAPKVGSIEGLLPAIALSQDRLHHHPRSTVATLAGVHGQMRLLFERMGTPFCLRCGAEVRSQRFDEAYEILAGLPAETRLLVLAPRRRREGESDAELADWVERSGYRRLRIEGQLHVIEGLSLTGVACVEVAVDRLTVSRNTRRRLRGSLQAALDLGDGQAQVAVEEGSEEFSFAIKPSCVACGEPFIEVSESLFSFNSPQGACQQCNGLGTQSGVQFERLFDGGRSCLIEAIGPLWVRYGHEGLFAHLDRFCQKNDLSLEMAVAEFPDSARQVLWKGKRGRSGFPGLAKLVDQLRAKASGDELDWLEDRLGDSPCEVCGGTRYRQEVRSIKINGESIASVCQKSVSGALTFLRAWTPEGSNAVVGQTIGSVMERSLETIDELGLGYLTLDRRSDTLSSGELQRLRLASALGSEMTQVLYILDEPTMGLHASDVEKLLDALRRLGDGGNTVLLVEHDPEILSKADLLIDMGPGAGKSGGHIVAQGSPEQVCETDSLTGRFLSGRLSLGRNARRAPGSGGWLGLHGLRGHNLKGMDVEIPLGCLVCVTGISGSGKSSLVHGTLFPLLAVQLQGSERHPLAFDSCTGAEQLERIVCVDQKPIGLSPRSTVVTYTGLLQPIRRMFAQIPEARLRAYRPGHFSFNAREGMCMDCGGSGLAATPDEQFEGAETECGTCSGRRFKREVLDIRFRDHNISEVLELDVDAALKLFESIPEIVRILAILGDVGLGYIHLGQSARSLSGGEAQRVKLASELGRPRNDQTIYVLDEPTTGLHMEDIRYLLDLLQRLIDQGHSVVVVEHHIEFVACSDYLIDLGPGAGEAGGQVVAKGTPEEVAAVTSSRTGHFLQRRLARA